MKTIAAALLILCFAVGAQANPPKHWYSDKYWWMGEAVMAAAITADAASTVSSRCQSPCNETSFILGPHPKTSWVAVASGGEFVAESGLQAEIWHLAHGAPALSKGWQLAGYIALPATVSTLHFAAAANNWSLDAQCRRAGIVCNHP